MVDFHISVDFKDEGGAEEPVIGWVQLSGQSEVSSSVTFSNHNKTSRVWSVWDPLHSYFSYAIILIKHSKITWAHFVARATLSANLC